MKVYAVDGSGQDVIQLKEICQKNGWEMKVMRRIGRPRVEYPVQKVVNAYRELKKIRAVARRLGINPGPVYRILKEAEALEDEKN